MSIVSILETVDRFVAAPTYITICFGDILLTYCYFALLIRVCIFRTSVLTSRSALSCTLLQKASHLSISNRYWWIARVAWTKLYRWSLRKWYQPFFSDGRVSCNLTIRFRRMSFLARLNNTLDHVADVRTILSLRWQATNVLFLRRRYQRGFGKTLEDKHVAFINTFSAPGASDTLNLDYGNCCASWLNTRPDMSWSFTFTCAKSP